MQKNRPVAARLAALAAPHQLAVPAFAQSVTLPPSGDNQKSSVSQWIGLVEVNVTYNSPDITAPDGTTDRRGKIWGQLVPWGWGTESFGTCGTRCPGGSATSHRGTAPPTCPPGGWASSPAPGSCW